MLTSKQKKWLGGILLVVGLMFISPIPDVSDGVGFTLFSVWKGVQIDASNFSLYFLDYTLLTVLLGGIMVFFGLSLLGKNWKYLKKKMDLGHYKIAVGLSILVVVIIAFLDVKGLIYWASFSDMASYTGGLQGMAFWNFFKTIAFSLMLIVPICYWFFVKKDKSETLALFLSSLTLFYFGLADVLYFVFQKASLPEVLPWLNSHPVIGWISANILGQPSVTNYALLFSVLVGFVIVFFMTKILKERF